MPRLSDTMQQGTVVKWNVKEGQKIKSGDVIADIETDKATMELQSFDDGVVAKLSAPEGQTIPVGQVIMLIASDGEDPAAVRSGGGSGGDAGAKPGQSGSTQTRSAASAETGASDRRSEQSPRSTGVALQGAPTQDSPTAQNGTHAAHADQGERIFVSPLARKIAEEAAIDLSQLTGSGPGGRIVRKDVEEAIASGSAKAGKAGSAPAPAKGAPARSAPQVPAAGATLSARTIPLSNMRRIIAQRLVESKTTIPHYQVTVDIDMEPLLDLRAQLNEQLAKQGVKLSVNDFLVKACALAMHQHPYVNSRWSQKGDQASIEYVEQVNIGVAIALPIHDDGTGGGLVVATIRDADHIGLRHISAETKRVSEKAREKGLSPQEMSDSTFTISNLGMFGVSHFTAIINPPNTAILAVGAAMDVPVVRDGKVVPGKIMSMTMSSDHRVVDGAMAAQYLATVKDLLEKPATLLV
jgi:pyruvate dehydrogenase E2 component (dihydrolipoamide acetyltransferase)